jgi:hypothetical protein
VRKRKRKRKRFEGLKEKQKEEEEGAFSRALIVPVFELYHQLLLVTSQLLCPPSGRRPSGSISQKHHIHIDLFSSSLIALSHR